MGEVSGGSTSSGRSFSRVIYIISATVAINGFDSI